MTRLQEVRGRQSTVLEVVDGGTRVRSAITARVGDFPEDGRGLAASGCPARISSAPGKPSPIVASWIEVQQLVVPIVRAALPMSSRQVASVA
jgi:hypothetical protein